MEEEETLFSRRTILENAETLNKHAQKAYTALSSDHGEKDNLYAIMKACESLSEIDDTSSFSERASELYYEAEELARDISSYISGIEFNSSELRQIEDRLDVINTLKRKYNGEISDILKFYDDASERLAFLRSYDENKDELIKKCDLLRCEVGCQ